MKRIHSRKLISEIRSVLGTADTGSKLPSTYFPSPRRGRSLPHPRSQIKTRARMYPMLRVALSFIALSDRTHTVYLQDHRLRDRLLYFVFSETASKTTNRFAYSVPPFLTDKTTTGHGRKALLHKYYSCTISLQLDRRLLPRLWYSTRTRHGPSLLVCWGTYERTFSKKC